MEVEFDPAKDEANIRKHGVSLLFGVAVLGHLVAEQPDLRRDYGEDRMNAYGFVNGRLFACTYVKRGLAYRFISVRKASKREQQIWLSSK